MANPGEKLRPGMFARIAVVLPGTAQVLAIPATAVLYAPYGDLVYVIEEHKDEKTGQSGKVLRQQFVRLDEKRGDFVAITSGLKANETVVGTGAFKLRNGQAVIIDNKLAPQFSLEPKPENNQRQTPNMQTLEKATTRTCNSKGLFVHLLVRASAFSRFCLFASLIFHETDRSVYSASRACRGDQPADFAGHCPLRRSGGRRRHRRGGERRAPPGRGARRQGTGRADHRHDHHPGGSLPADRSAGRPDRLVVPRVRLHPGRSGDHLRGHRPDPVAGHVFMAAQAGDRGTPASLATSGGCAASTAACSMPP